MSIKKDIANYSGIFKQIQPGDNTSWGTVQNTLLPPESITINPNNCVVLAGTLVLGEGVLITISSGSILRMV